MRIKIGADIDTVCKGAIWVCGGYLCFGVQAHVSINDQLDLTRVYLPGILEFDTK